MPASIPACPRQAGDPHPLTRKDPGLWALLLATALLLAWSWYRQEGYQLADSVEYLERAQGLARGHALVDSVAIRSFGFSGLLVPLFWIYEALGLEDPVRIMQAAQLLQVLLTLAVVAVTTRLCARFVDRTSGLAAGALLAFNPIVLRWGVEPVSGIAAALFVALAVSRALGERRVSFVWRDPDQRERQRLEQQCAPLRDAWMTGIWLGLAFLMAYQTILVVGSIFLVLLVRDGRRRPAWPLSILGGVAGVVLLQCLLDRWYYGVFGVSVWTYFLENFGSSAALLVHKTFGGLPLIGAKMSQLAQWLYNSAFEIDQHTLSYQGDVIAGQASITSSHPRTWYLTNLGRCLVAPAAILVGLGLLRSLILAPRTTAILWFVVAVNLLVMSIKGSKDFRLWLPFLPLISVLGGIGFGAMFLRHRTLQFAALIALMTTMIFGAFEFQAANTRKYGGYWRAMSFVNQRAARLHAKPAQPVEPATAADGKAPEPRRLRLSAAYHWSMFLRETRDVELVKLPYHLDNWQQYDVTKRAADLATIASLDAFITHLPVLTENPDLFEVINRDYAVAAAFYDRVVYETLGPIYVLERRSAEQGGLRFFQSETGRSLDQACADVGHRPLVEFERTFDGRPEHLALVEAQYIPLPGDGHGWITYVWHGGSLAPPDWVILDRLTAPDFRNSWQNNHKPAYGMQPTSQWTADTTLREGYLVVAEADAYLMGGAYRRLGGRYRRGDLLPLTLWVDVVHLNEEERVAERFPAVDPATRERIDEAAPTSDLASPSGNSTSKDGMTRAGAMFVPVHPAGRRSDNGEPVPLSEPK